MRVGLLYTFAGTVVAVSTVLGTLIVIDIIVPRVSKPGCCT